MLRYLLLLCAVLVAQCAPLWEGVLPELENKLCDSSSLDLPIVLWHGMGDTCCGTKRGIGKLKIQLEEKYGVFVHSIGFGSWFWDMKASFLGNANDQVEKVCQELAEIEELQHGFDAIGFSQGGQFLRAVVERCQERLPRVRFLITLGAQHQGIMDIPDCLPDSTTWCSFAHSILAYGAYWSWPAHNVIQAQYVKDPYHLDSYLKNNIFLPDINNDKEEKNPQYAENLASLHALVLFRFENDTVVEPKDSAWFSFFNGTDLLTLQDQEIYAEDWIGLRALDYKGALIFDSCPTQHMRFSTDWFFESVIDKYLVTKC